MIEIKGLSIKLGDFGLEDVNFVVADKEYFAILGPSGAGKTILLECLGGIRRIRKGTIAIGGVDITGYPPEKRRIGYVPQDYVLFPFLNVAENVQFGLKREGLSKPEMVSRIASLADLLGISHLLTRSPLTLSGGEKQRVALARALAINPRILLMDEPLSSLDAQTAKHLRLELKRIHRELGITTLHVTHNHEEAQEMADRIAVLHNGRLQQTGTPSEIFFSPVNDAVSDFVGSLNVLSCESSRYLGSGLVDVECGGVHIIVLDDYGTVQRIAVSPRDILLSDIPFPGPEVNRYKGKVQSIEQTGALVKLSIEVGRNLLRAEIADQVFAEMRLAPGKDVYLILRLRSLKPLGSATPAFLP